MPDGLIEVGEPWAAKQNEACQHDARPPRRGNKRDEVRMILISSESGNHSVLSRWYLDLWIVFYWKKNTQRNLNRHSGNIVFCAVNNYRHCQHAYDSALLLAADESVTVGALLFSDAGLGVRYWCTSSFNLFNEMYWKHKSDRLKFVWPLGVIS